MGCPKGATSMDQCDPRGASTYDVKEWNATREAAKKLFDLKER